MEELRENTPPIARASIYLRDHMMTKVEFRQWASGGFYRSFRENKEQALVDAQLNSTMLQPHERSSLALTFDVVAEKALEMGGWLGGGKMWLWLISTLISYCILKNTDTLWWVTPMSIVFLLALRDRWVCRSRAEAYKELAGVLDANYQEPRVPFYWRQSTTAKIDQKQVAGETLGLK